MATPYIAEIRLVSFPFAPRGWAACDGQTLPINQNQALFSLLGTTYGGNGMTTFALPNARGRALMGQGPGYFAGEAGGELAHTLAGPEMASHSHDLKVGGVGTTNVPAGSFLATPGVNPRMRALYSPGHDSTAGPGELLPTGSGLPHENRQPFQVLLYVIALQGVFPPR